jgi:hypothetical protein
VLFLFEEFGAVIFMRRVVVGVVFHEYIRKKISYDEMSRRIADLNRGDFK